MSGEVDPKGTMAAEPSAQAILDQHISEQPHSVQRIHKVLQVLVLLGIVAVIGLLVWAIYVSFRAATFGTSQVAFWWFVWWASDMGVALIMGVDAVITKSSPIGVWSSYRGEVDLGAKAVSTGRTLIFIGLVGLLISSGLAIYVAITGADLLQYFIIAMVLLGVGAGVVSIVQSVVRSIRGK